ncbi:hypothetical protein GQ43DRAFT_364396 [Delitschia confertaspora ATCC 74209]|uniref:Uncharacterized protein n=1 Tax=Delitschia confertaspora ATCC 74209 TaxID=1513339 RepID=A0A9P4JUA7_9PLEO|nr:hypothetical protein GQ43DRAFT_364396 [Delitschia confertaspora ATCC 74209]
MAYSNFRPLAIFSSYMLLCFSLTVFIIRDLYKSYRSRSKSHTSSKPSSLHIFLFSLLAAASLATTWYYMFQFFAYSYRDWIFAQQLSQQFFLGHEHGSLQLGWWLKDTQLFKEAWGTVVMGARRFWWSGQIFLFASYLGLIFEVKGARGGIPHTWAFMLLGQVVAISFATNLFHLALLLKSITPPAQLENHSRKNVPSSRGKILGPWLPNLLAFVGSASGLLLDEPIFQNPDWFMPLLLLPHLALMLPPLLHAVLPRSWEFADAGVPFAGRIYDLWWSSLCYGGLFKLALMTFRGVTEVGFSGIMAALHEHPAVSSVGWDVIFCWVSWGCWTLIHRGERIANGGNTKETSKME